MTLEPITLGDRASQTMLRHFSMCPRSAYLYTKYRDAGFQNGPMVRGSAFHEIVERSVALMMEQGEPTIPAEVVKVIVDEILAERHVPWEEHDFLRECAYRWASETAIDPNAVLALETLFEIDVDGFKVRCRIDYAAAVDDRTVKVEDYKSSRAADSYEEVARKRRDGSWSAKNFQLILYALALAYGVPVRVENETCALCEGVGEVAKGFSFAAVGTPEIVSCPQCSGAGRLTVETPDPFPIASRAESFDLEFVYPGIETRDEKMMRVPLTLTRPELDAYMGSLHGLVARVRKAEADNDWPAVASQGACGICPAKAECPLPAALRDHVPVNTMQDAGAVAEALYQQKKLHTAFQSELRAFAKANGAIPFGAGMVWDFSVSQTEEITDRAGMFDAMDRAARFGESFDRADWVRSKKRTDFKPRQLTAEEIERSNHVGDDEPEAEGTREEGSRWGEDAPF